MVKERHKHRESNNSNGASHNFINTRQFKKNYSSSNQSTSNNNRRSNHHENRRNQQQYNERNQHQNKGGKKRRRLKTYNLRPRWKLEKLRALKARTLENPTAFVQILGTGMDTHDTLPSILLVFGDLSIIVNAGEGLQRLCEEHKIKLPKIDYIFLSRVCSETVGGLSGLLFFAGFKEERCVKLRGPSDLEKLVCAIKPFLPHAVISAKSFKSALSSEGQSSIASSLSEGPILVCENEVVKISAIIVQPNASTDFSVKYSDMAVIYICELAEIKGKYHREKAEALGVIAERKHKKLQQGKSVNSSHLDIMVHPCDVMDSSIRGPIVFIVDCPTESHAEKLLITESFSKYYAKLSDEAPDIVNCIVHLTPASIVNTTNYQSWMKKFGSVQHIMAGYSMKNVGKPILGSSARITYQLNYLCPQFFPAPAVRSYQHHNGAEVVSIASGEEPTGELCDIVLAENLLKFILLPYAELGLDKSNVPSPIVPSQVISDLPLEHPEIADAAKYIGQFWGDPIETKGVPTRESLGLIEGSLLNHSSRPSCLDNIRRDDAEIVLLGTGAAQPSRCRNVSSIFVNLFSKGSLLLDCGEGTLAQLKRRYGLDGADDAVRKLRCIWISHIHADHHAGLVRILALRRDLLKGTPHEPLCVIGPKQLQEFLYKYKCLEDLDMHFLDCKMTTAASWDLFELESIKCQTLSSDCTKIENVNNANEEDDADPTSFCEESCEQCCSKRQKPSAPKLLCFFKMTVLKRLTEALREMGLERLTSFPVVHCYQSFGVILKARERVNNAGALIPGWKVVYSGDTRPCVEVMRASEEATLLIHEATFDDCLVEEAISRKHSTIKEALEVGDAAGVYRIILTHFSQRSFKFPSFYNTNSQNACIAFDLMSINMADLPVLPRILPYFKLLFRDDRTPRRFRNRLCD